MIIFIIIMLTLFNLCSIGGDLFLRHLLCKLGVALAPLLKGLDPLLGDYPRCYVLRPLRNAAVDVDAVRHEVISLLCSCLGVDPRLENKADNSHGAPDTTFDHWVGSVVLGQTANMQTDHAGLWLVVPYEGLQIEVSIVNRPRRFEGVG